MKILIPILMIALFASSGICFGLAIGNTDFDYVPAAAIQALMGIVFAYVYRSIYKK